MCNKSCISLPNTTILFSAQNRTSVLFIKKQYTISVKTRLHFETDTGVFKIKSNINLRLT